MRGQVSLVVRARSGERLEQFPPPEGPNRFPGRWRSWAWGSRPPSAWGSGSGLGLWVDSAAGTAPVFLLVGLALGLAVAAFSVIKQIRTYL